MNRKMTRLSACGTHRQAQAGPFNGVAQQAEKGGMGKTESKNKRRELDMEKQVKVIIAFAVGIPVTFLIYLILSYHYGAAIESEIVGMGRESFGLRQNPLVPV